MKRREMLRWFVISISLFVTHVSSEDSICQLVSTFDAVCKQNDVIYILSANPCKSATSVSLTIVNFKNGSQYKHLIIDRDTKAAIPIWNAIGKGVVLTQHLRPGSDNVARYRQTRLHVLLHLADIEDYARDARLEGKIFDVMFPMFTADCSLTKVIPPTLTHEMCHYGHKLGNYSSLCVIPRNSSIRAANKDYSIVPGIYIIIADVCTVPYSVTILSLLFSGYNVKRRFTQDKSDTYLTLPGGHSKCGLVLLMKEHYGMHIHVLLLYGCGAENITILDSVFPTQSGVICPLSNCVSLRPNHPLSQTCNVSWIYSKGETREAHIEVSLDICNPPYSVWWDYYLDKKASKDFPFERHEILKLGEQKPFHIGLPSDLHVPVPTDNGYLYLDWGTASLFIRGIDDLVFVSIFRHYPLPNNSIPLFRTEFWIKDLLETKSKFCPESEDKSLKTGLPIAAAGLILFIVVVVILCCRRAKRRRQEGGLPYFIHLGDIDEESPPNDVTE